MVMALAILALLPSSTTTLLAQELDTKDYTITDFGFLNSNIPFITVQGIAGGSYDASLRDEGYHAYVINTNKGNFMIAVARIWGHVIAFLGQDIGLTSISDVYAIEVTTGDPDETCKTGDHLSRIISHRTQ